jgi:hypothetical protein
MLDWLNDFAPPQNATEALERSLEFASEETRWTKSELFTSKASNPTCTDVRACAMGILLIACFDGPAVDRYYEDEDELEFKLAKGNPIYQSATKMLAQAARPNSVRRNKINFHDAAHFVEHFNDGARHHSKIVELFEYAIEISKGKKPRRA